MKKRNYPYLRLIPSQDLLKPSWHKPAPHQPVADISEINLQMDKLHGLSGAVFLLTILLEVCILGFYEILYAAMGATGIVAFTAMILAVGLIGAILFYLMSAVERAVRQSLNEHERKEDCNV